MMTDAWSKAGQAAGMVLLAFVALVMAYLSAGLIGGALPANRGWRPPADGVTIAVETNGVHTDLILPKVAAGIDWRDIARAGDIADPRYADYDHVAIGWGEARFYLETPTWADIRPTTVLRAATGSDATLMHVEHLPMPAASPEVRRIVLRPAEYRRLAGFIRSSFAARPKIFHGYGAYDAFYSASGRYDALMTCNAWTGAALRSAGVRVGRWTPFAATVMGWF